MAERIFLEIVTPKGKAFSAAVDEVTAPSTKGEFGVMPGHLPMLVALRTGLVSYKEGAETRRCAVGSGFAEAGPSKVIVLADHYAVREDVDPVLLRKELLDVEADIAKLETQKEQTVEDKERLRQLIAEENWIAARLELYGDPPPATQRPHEEFGPPPPASEEEPTEGEA